VEPDLVTFSCTIYSRDRDGCIGLGLDACELFDMSCERSRQTCVIGVCTVDDERPVVNHVFIPVIVHPTDGYNVSETRLELMPERLGVIRRYLQVGFADFVRVPDVPFLG
jgi:hypothetical protein